MGIARSCSCCAIPTEAWPSKLPKCLEAAEDCPTVEGPRTARAARSRVVPTDPQSAIFLFSYYQHSKLILGIPKYQVLRQKEQLLLESYELSCELWDEE